MRKHLKRYIPDHEHVRSHRWLAMFGDTLLHPRLWHLNRHSAAGAVAVGLFCGLIPGPLQMLGAALMCIVFKVNLPLALVSTLYTNPLTIVPLYFAAYHIGSVVLGSGGEFVEPPPFEWSHIGAWVSASVEWMSGLGRPLALGLVLLASSLSALGYFLVWSAWRVYLLHAWHSRRNRRKAPAPTEPR
jgi:hypothetical protein